MGRPLVVFDGDCGFCRRIVENWRARAAGLDFEPSQSDRARKTGVPAERFAAAVVLIERDGRVQEGAEAVFRVLEHAGSPAWLLAYRRVPGFAAASEAGYKLVARRRAFFSSAARLLYGDDLRPSSNRASRDVFVALLGAAYFFAFASLYGQIDGLLGPDGILPAARWLAAAKAQVGATAYWALPSVFWLGASGAALKAACAAGAALGLVVVAGLVQGPALLALWALYLSTVSIGQEFLSFQWDILLLECGFLAMLVAPWSLKRGRDKREPPALGMWLVRWLAARLMLESGLVKLSSGDATWRGLTALTFHYQTQPLPTPVAWWAHHLPLAAQKTSCALMLAIELAAPLLALLPRRPRAEAAGAFVLLQTLIMITGNYGFFNVLAIALALALLDDRQLGLAREQGPPAARPRRLAALAFAIFSLPLSLAQVYGAATGRFALPSLVGRAYAAASPLHLVNGYGLFAVMTTQRDEISIEGSADGKRWREYVFKWKPGPLARRPAFVEPRMPRLDWQMWFAALGSCRDNPWLLEFIAGLARGRPEVLSLLASNPFPETPPRYFRAMIAEYRFTTSEERRRTGDWWTQGEPRLYCPVLEARQR